MDRDPTMTRPIPDWERAFLEQHSDLFETCRRVHPTFGEIMRAGQRPPITFSGIRNEPGITITNGPAPFISTAAWPRAERRARAAQPRAGSGRWYSISNVTVDEATINIYDEIGFWGVTAQDFADEVTKLSSRVLNVHINSPGGEVFDGLAIMNTLRQHAAEVRVFVDGLAASAASFIAVGAAAPGHLSIARNAEMMIHDAMGWAVGNAAEMRELAARLDKVSDNIADVYAQRAGGDVATWRAAMLAETWYTGAEAVAAGLADKVTGETEEAEQVTDRWDLSVFAHAGRRNAPAPPVAAGMRGCEDGADEHTATDGDTPTDQPVDDTAPSADDVAQSDDGEPDDDAGHGDAPFLPAWEESTTSTTTDRADAWGAALTRWGT